MTLNFGGTLRTASVSHCSESTDVTDTGRLIIFIRMAFTDMNAKEELLRVLLMKEGTLNILNYFKNFIEKTQVPVVKFTTDPRWLAA